MTDVQANDASLLAELNQKIDRLTAQVTVLTEEAAQQRSKRQEWDDLQADLMPVSKEAFGLAMRQLGEVEQCVRLENILHLAKRLMRNTCNFEQMLDQLEGLMGFMEDIGPLSRDVFLNVMNRLDTMERKGYLSFLQAMLEIGDDVVTSFNREDLQNMRHSVPELLEMVKEMSRPEVVAKLRRSVAALNDEEPLNVSLFGLAGQMNDPAVRRGMSRTLSALKIMAE